MRWPGWPSLPLLSKELIEQSNRRRTFVLRTAYAVLLYVSLMWTLVAESGWNSNSLAMLGRGRELFDMLVGFQFFAIYAFLPGLAAGVLAAEKERDTLAMLLLTKLGGWTIVVEKLLSRLMPLAMLMLLSLPLLAVAYSLGGVSLLKIVDAVWVLGISAMQVGALTVFCSAWYRTAAGAFVATYILGFSIICFPLLLYAMLALLVLLLGGHVTGNGLDELMELTLNFFGPYVLYEGIEYGSRFGTPIVVNGLGDWILHLMYLGFRTSPLWITGFAFLAGARLATRLCAAAASDHEVSPRGRWRVPRTQSEQHHQRGRVAAGFRTAAGIPSDLLAGNHQETARHHAVSGPFSRGNPTVPVDRAAAVRHALCP